MDLVIDYLGWLLSNEIADGKVHGEFANQLYKAIEILDNIKKNN